MQRIIQINIAGRIIPIEENAYLLIKDYITALERQFANEEGNDEIIQDIENRIAELFTIRLQSGSPAIDRADVQKVIDTLGAVSELSGNASKRSGNDYNTISFNPAGKQGGGQYTYSSDRLLRNPYDKVFGGVCSGIANYFDIDPVILRLIFVVLFLTFGMGLVAYIIAWIVIPVAKSPEELRYATSADPMNFHDITRNLGADLKDLKRRGEDMSRELRDFFARKK